MSLNTLNLSLKMTQVSRLRRLTHSIDTPVPLSPRSLAHSQVLVWVSNLRTVVHTSTVYGVSILKINTGSSQYSNYKYHSSFNILLYRFQNVVHEQPWVHLIQLCSDTVRSKPQYWCSCITAVQLYNTHAHQSAIARYVATVCIGQMRPV